MSHLFVLVRMTAHITIRGRNKFATSPSVLCSVLLFPTGIINQIVERYNIFHASLIVRYSEDGKLYLYDVIDIKKETSNLFQSNDFTQ